jgi:uncharacterized membrane protein
LSVLQITNTLRLIGNKGRAVIAEMYPRFDRVDSRRDNVIDLAESARLGAVTQTVRYFGEPRTISKLDILNLVRIAEQTGAVIEITRAVGDTLSDDTLLMKIRGARGSQEQYLRRLKAGHSVRARLNGRNGLKTGVRMLGGTAPVNVDVAEIFPSPSRPQRPKFKITQQKSQTKSLGP